MHHWRRTNEQNVPLSTVISHKFIIFCSRSSTHATIREWNISCHSVFATSSPPDKVSVDAGNWHQLAVPASGRQQVFNVNVNSSLLVYTFFPLGRCTFSSGRQLSTFVWRHSLVDEMSRLLPLCMVSSSPVTFEVRSIITLMTPMRVTFTRHRS